MSATISRGWERNEVREFYGLLPKRRLQHEKQSTRVNFEAQSVSCARISRVFIIFVCTNLMFLYPIRDNLKKQIIITYVFKRCFLIIWKRLKSPLITLAHGPPHSPHNSARKKYMTDTSQGEQPNAHLFMWLPNFGCGARLVPKTKKFGCQIDALTRCREGFSDTN